MGGGGSIVAHRDLRGAVHRNNGSSCREAGVGDVHTRHQASGGAECDVGRAKCNHTCGIRGKEGGCPSGAAVNDQFPRAAGFRATSGEHAAHRAGADAAREGVVLAQQAAFFEVEDICAVGEGDVIAGLTGEA